MWKKLLGYVLTIFITLCVQLISHYIIMLFKLWVSSGSEATQRHKICLCNSEKFYDCTVHDECDSENDSPLSV